MADAYRPDRLESIRVQMQNYLHQVDIAQSPRMTFAVCCDTLDPVRAPVNKQKKHQLVACYHRLNTSTTANCQSLSGAAKRMGAHQFSVSNRSHSCIPVDDDDDATIVGHHLNK